MYIVTHVVGLEIAHVSHTLKYSTSNVFYINFIYIVKVSALFVKLCVGNKRYENKLPR